MTDETEAVEVAEEKPRRRRSRKVAPPEGMPDPSPLPEKFEDFEARHMAPQAAEKPKSDPNARPIGGMVEKTWAGRKMWQCPRCNATTFKEGDAKTHTCKRIMTPDDIPDEEPGKD